MRPPRPVMRPPRFILALFAFDLSLGLLAGLGHVVATRLGVEGIDFVRLGVEANLPSWYSASQLLLVAVAFGLAAGRAVQERRAWLALAPAAFFVLLSLDEGAQLHERLGWWAEATFGVGSGLITGPWMFVAVPLYGVLALSVFRAVWPLVRGRTEVLALGTVGCALFVVAAAGIEGLGNLTAPDAFMVRRVLGVFEEVGEMIAATTLLWAGWALCRAEGVRIAFGPEPGATPDEGHAESAFVARPSRGRPVAPTTAPRPERTSPVRVGTPARSGA